MKDRQELSNDLDTLATRLRALVAISPGGAVFWAVFNRKWHAIEAAATDSDRDFVRFRVGAMLDAENLVPGCHDFAPMAHTTHRAAIRASAA